MFSLYDFANTSSNCTPLHVPSGPGSNQVDVGANTTTPMSNTSNGHISSAARALACRLCNKEISDLELLIHTPACYYDFCATRGRRAMCTCPKCKGTTVCFNPASAEESPTNSLNQALATPSAASTSNKRKRSAIPPPLGPYPVGSNNNDKGDDAVLYIPKPVFSAEQSSMKRCAICNKQKSPSAIPLPPIYLKKKEICVLMVCQKKHLEEEAMSELGVKVDEQLKFLTATKNRPMRELMEGSDDESSARETSVKGYRCAGLRCFEPRTRCARECSADLFVKCRKERRYFCKGSCLIRYIVYYFGLAIKSVKESSKKKGGKTLVVPEIPLPDENDDENDENGNPKSDESDGDQPEEEEEGFLGDHVRNYSDSEGDGDGYDVDVAVSHMESLLSRGTTSTELEREEAAALDAEAEKARAQQKARKSSKQPNASKKSTPKKTPKKVTQPAKKPPPRARKAAANTTTNSRAKTTSSKSSGTRGKR